MWTPESVRACAPEWKSGSPQDVLYQADYPKRIPQRTAFDIARTCPGRECFYFYFSVVRPVICRKVSGVKGAMAEHCCDSSRYRCTCLWTVHWLEFIIQLTTLLSNHLSNHYNSDLTTLPRQDNDRELGTAGRRFKGTHPDRNGGTEGVWQPLQPCLFWSISTGRAVQDYDPSTVQHFAYTLPSILEYKGSRPSLRRYPPVPAKH